MFQPGTTSPSLPYSRGKCYKVSSCL